MVGRPSQGAHVQADSRCGSGLACVDRFGLQWAAESEPSVLTYRW